MVMEGSGWGEGEQDGRLLIVGQWLGLSLSKFPSVGPSLTVNKGRARWVGDRCAFYSFC